MRKIPIHSKTIFWVLLCSVTLFFIIPLSMAALEQNPGTGIGIVNLANPTIQAFFQEYAKWCTTTPAYNRVQCYGTSNSTTNQVSYFEGVLQYNAATNTFSGQGTQFFNDRTFYMPAAGELLDPYAHPFNPKKTDAINIVLNAKTNQAVITLAGNKVDTINLSCYYRILSGTFVSGMLNQTTATMYTISLKTMALQPPPK